MPDELITKTTGRIRVSGLNSVLPRAENWMLHVI